MFTNFEIIVFFLCYLIGSIPFGLIISKLLKIDDPRSIGSKNIGATNMMRINGWKLGVLTLLLDIFKAYIPIIILLKFFYFVHIEIAFLAIFLGHLFPVWIKFRGGKGIAVLIGSLLAYNPFYGYIFILIWLITAILTKYSSLAALVALISVFIFILFENNSLSVVMSLVLFLIIYKHRTNISRLVKGKESKIILKKEN